MNTAALPVGAVSGAIFAGVAYAISRHTRPILVAGVLVAALLYVYHAAHARTSPAWLAAELAGVVLYGAMALRGLRGSPWWLAAGRPRHRRDVAAGAPGLYFAGPRFQHRTTSALLGGVGEDAAHVAWHVRARCDAAFAAQDANERPAFHA